MNKIQQLYDETAGTNRGLQGNIAFAVGCVCAGIHAADDTPARRARKPSTRASLKRRTARGLVRERGRGRQRRRAARHGRARRVVTMKIPGLYQACDAFTRVSYYMQPKGALVYYIASDFTPSSKQHVIDPRYLFKSCCVPVF
ncbi:hypothetical protein [uncultured Bilophila sp.]|uniref:hypothetical protein n=1 Tax=uncultured Bilophila sp. TaxID=529385 RepID=UPI00280A6E2D|nr:hypothetical protein [uncultured Bilophila sp.]